MHKNERMEKKLERKRRHNENILISHDALHNFLWCSVVANHYALCIRLYPRSAFTKAKYTYLQLQYGICNVFSKAPAAPN